MGKSKYFAFHSYASRLPAPALLATQADAMARILLVQLWGFPNSCGTIIHTIRNWLQQDDDLKNGCLLTDDLEHACNHVDRSELRRVAPGLATWYDTRSADPSSVMFGTVKILRLRGVQEEDRLGRLLFVSEHLWFLLPR